MADISFAPTSIQGIEFPDDREPDMYRATRAAMEANSRQELRELQTLDHHTTAYPSLGCTAGAMSPTYPAAPACDLASMRDVSHGITAYTQDGAPLLTQFNTQRAQACADMQAAGLGLGPGAGTPPIGYQPNTYGGAAAAAATTTVKKQPRSRHMGVRMLNSVRGALYDMQHFSELPPAQSGESPSQVTWYAMTRDNRLPYLMLLFIAILVVVAMVLGIKKYQRHRRV